MGRGATRGQHNGTRRGGGWLYIDRKVVVVEVFKDVELEHQLIIPVIAMRGETSLDGHVLATSLFAPRRSTLTLNSLCVISC